LDFQNKAVGVLLQLRLPSFDTVLHNARESFYVGLMTVSNGLSDRILGLH